ncbi:MAG: branched-chain amino acid ABC transporter permease [Chloroflexi bacterium]|nr:branched-chain amino acid ABC transporter permease [Chloroflexota bacterium]
MKLLKTLTWVVGTGFLIILPFLIPTRMHVAVIALYYAILASSWALLAGYGGQFSFAHMAFAGLGAYTAGLIGKFIRFTTAPTGLCTEFSMGDWWLVVQDAGSPTCLETAKAAMPVGALIVKLPAWLDITMGIIVGGLFGLLIGALVLRLRRTYLALFTIAFAEILRTVINAERDITGGPGGLKVDPLFPNGLTIFGRTFEAADKLPSYYVMLVLFLAVLALMYWLVGSRFGLFIRSIREDEEAAASLGVNVVRYKILLFTITAMIAAAAGGVYAHFVRVIAPNMMVIKEMSVVIAMAVIGGMESLLGAAIGAIIIEFALEQLRSDITIGSFSINMTDWRLVVFGALLMITLRFWGNGLIFPIIQRITRRGVAEETVAKRVQPASTPTAEAPVMEQEVEA